MFWNSIKLWHAIYSQQNRTYVTVCQLRHTYKIDCCKLSTLVKPQKRPRVSGRESERAAVGESLSLWASSTLPLANAGVLPSLLQTLHRTWTYYTAWMTSTEHQEGEGCRSFIETGLPPSAGRSVQTGQCRPICRTQHRIPPQHLVTCLLSSQEEAAGATIVTTYIVTLSLNFQEQWWETF